MTGPLGGLRVIDLSTGIAGPMATMLLADHGADVVKVEPPGGDPTRSNTGARVWHRGKRSLTLDLDDPSHHEQLLALLDRADVLVESFAPGEAAALGLDWATLSARNPRLVHCSITAYGRHLPERDLPAVDALVMARTGLHWEQRGRVGTTIGLLCDLPVELDFLDIPPGCADGPEREGPLFPRSSWPSLGAAFLATTGISAALYAREATGRGQWVETSLLQGVLAATAGAWQRPEDPHADGYLCWIMDPRGSKGHFLCADGRWVQNWVPNPAFALGVSQGDHLDPEAAKAPRDDPSRIGPDYPELVVLAHYHPEMAAAYAKFAADDWVRVAAEVGVPLQRVRTPEEALSDPALIDAGMVTTIDDPEVGPIRAAGVLVRMEGTPASVGGPAPLPGQHTDEILAELGIPHRPAAAPAAPRDLAHPLEGVVVLDLGLAIAGPWGTQVLSDLGATVIKTNTLWDDFWHSTHIAFCANRGKQSISLNLKDPRAMEILHRLVERADVVQHNMRYEAAVRLGVDDESLRKINPSLIYCHTAGFDPERAHLPGNDQTGACLAGIEWEDGGVAAGGKPIWSLTSFGDTGNGFLSAIGIIQALYHRDRTGEGQFLTTNILAAGLLNTSYVWIDADGNGVERASLDRGQFGLGPLHRLYETAAGWLCLAVPDGDDAQARAVAAVLGLDALDLTDPEATSAAIGAALRSAAAAEWRERLTAAGVLCEIVDDTFVNRLFDDPAFREAGLVGVTQQAQVGRFEQFGHLWSFSDTPSRIAGPPLVVGHDTVALLTELGYERAAIDSLLDDKVVKQATLTQERAQ
jgi:crotonobetainyl-CoA:carnitine CoA-transferase CaiB-like acyl-CoA transferase